jgi:hypothetical protein
MRRLPGLNRRRAVLAGLLAVVMSMGATAAWAYWLTSGVGSGVAKTGSLAAPTNPTATYATGASSVSVSWTASAGTPAPTGYFVTRVRTSDSATFAACGTSATSTITAVACTDSAVPDGTYLYRVTALYLSWSATSLPSNTVVVVKATPTTTTLSSSSNPSVVGQTVTYTATVTSGSTGTVTFKDGTSTITCTGGNQTLSAGQATCSVAYTALGSHSITAVYSGDASHLTSTSATLSQAVNQAETSTTLTASPTSSVTGQSVTLTATVAVTAPGTGTPTGTVNFSNGASPLCSAAALNGSGVATCITTALPVGNKTLTAVYSGSTTLVTSTGTTTQTTTAASTTTALTTSAANVATGVTVTYTATVTTVAPGSGAPAGTVAFRDNGVTITCAGGTQAVSPTGTATCQVSYSATGTHPMTAVFTPAAPDYLTSTSGSVSQKVSAATGIVFSNLTTTAGASAACTGAGSTNYTCTSSGNNAPNNSTYTAQVSFVDSTGTPVVLSNATQTLNVAYTGKFSGAATIVIPGGAATSTASISGVMVGNNGGTIVVSTSSAPTWKATLVVN